MVYGYIYKIENMLNGKIYIGQTTKNPSLRKREHFSALKSNNHYNDHLQHSFNKYGRSNFKFTVLNYATDRLNLDKLEDDYINHYHCLNQDNGYNLKGGGRHGRLSSATRIKMSRIKRNTPKSLIHRKKISKAQRGKGPFRFTGVTIVRSVNPEGNHWQARIKFKGVTKPLFTYPDPLSAEIVHDLVLEEIYE